MELIQFYREQFVELCSQFEPNWEEDKNYTSGGVGAQGYRWKLHNADFNEFFQLVKLRDTPLFLVFFLELPYGYRHTDIYEFTRHYASDYENSVYYSATSTLLISCISIDSLNQSVLGFLNRARGELIDIVYSIVQQNV